MKHSKPLLHLITKVVTALSQQDLIRYSRMLSHSTPGLLLSDGTIHRDIQRTGVGWKGLGFNLCVVPPHDCIVPDFRVTGFMEVFWSRLEKTEETRVWRQRKTICTEVAILTLELPINAKYQLNY